VQDVFITGIKVRKGCLFVTTERAEQFEMDLRSGRVRALTRLGPRVDVPAAAEGQGPGQKESRMDPIVEDAKKSLAWIASALSSSGYVADFTPASLWEIDRFFDEQTQGGIAKPGRLLCSNLGSRLFAIGAYIGEVIRRARGGVWIGDENDPEAEINIEVRLPDGAILWPAGDEAIQERCRGWNRSLRFGDGTIGGTPTCPGRAAIAMAGPGAGERQ